MRIIITGGHLSPALCVIEKFPHELEILVIGRKNSFEGDAGLSFEYQTAQALHIPFRSISAGRFQRSFSKHTIRSIFKFPVGFFQAFRIVKDFKPHCILSFGGYVSLPVVLAAAILRVPIVIHEQTLTAGLANRIASMFAKKICISWGSSREFFPKKKTVLTGNPIKKFQIPASPAGRSDLKFQISNEKLPLIYITGGSAGSHKINVFIEDCLEKLLRTFRIIHQTGNSLEFGDFERLQNLRENLHVKLKERYVVTKFIPASDIGSVINASDLVVSRSGINTVTELICFGKPALLIPLNNEQQHNALFMQSLGLAEIIFQDTLTSDTLYKEISSMVSHREQYSKNAENAKKIVPKGATQKIIEIVKVCGR